MSKMKASGCDQISADASLPPGGTVMLTGIGAVIHTTGQRVSAESTALGPPLWWHTFSWSLSAGSECSKTFRRNTQKLQFRVSTKDINSRGGRSKPHLLRPILSVTVAFYKKLFGLHFCQLMIANVLNNVYNEQQSKLCLFQHLLMHFIHQMI